MSIKVFHVGDEVIVVIYQDYKKSLKLINFIRDKLFYLFYRNRFRNLTLEQLENRLRNLALEQFEAIKEIIDDNKED